MLICADSPDERVDSAFTCQRIQTTGTLEPFCGEWHKGTMDEEQLVSALRGGDRGNALDECRGGPDFRNARPSDMKAAPARRTNKRLGLKLPFYLSIARRKTWRENAP
jgi:hypothetical protein